MSVLFCRCLIAVIAVAIASGCNTTPAPNQPTLLDQTDQPHSLLKLGVSLLDRPEDLAQRIGPVGQPANTQIPEPPMVKDYSLTALEKLQIDPMFGQLVVDFEMAKIHDPMYQTALFEYQEGQISADLSSLAYTPSVSFTNRFLENESASRTTLSISQPLFNMDLLATVQEEDSRRAAAQAVMKSREYELIDRVFTAVTNLIKAQEKLVVNAARVQALEDESSGSKRQFEFGQGTITDVRDTAVRLEQARAEQIKMESAKSSALRLLEQLTGRKPDPAAYALRFSRRELKVDEVSQYMSTALQYNSKLIQARANQRLAELAALKLKSAYLPSVNFIATKSYSDNGNNSNSGVNFGVSVPVNSGTFYQAQIASARISQAQLSTMQARQKVEVDVEQNHADVVSGLNEVNIRLQAIESAQLSLTATEKSFSGGVRTRLDVLNSVQTLYVVNDQYINSVIDLAKNYLSLNNQVSRPVSTTIRDLQRLLF